MDSQAILLQELARRLERESKVKAFDGSYLFDAQRRFASDRSQYRIAICSRRAGKSVGIAWEMIDTAVNVPGSRCIYIGLTRMSAKDVVWDTLEELIRQFGFVVKTNLTELKIKFSNGSTIQLAGCENERAMARLLGRKFRKIFIDEAQSFPVLLEKLIDRTLAPMLMDDPESQLAMTGTPPPLLTGYYAKTWQSALNGNQEWSAHHWSLADNLPMLNGRNADDIIAKEARRRGMGLDDPTIQREYYGRLVQDTNALIFPLTDQNLFLGDPPDDLGSHVCGVDMGWEDPSAIYVMGWNAHRNDIYEAHEESAKHQTVSKLAKRLAEVHRRFKCQAYVADCGGGGKQTVESVNEALAAMGCPVVLEAAQKSDKLAALALFCDSIRDGRFKCRASSTLAEEAAILEWDYDSTGKRKFPDDKRHVGRHFDTVHAALYAFRKAQNLWTRPEPKVVDLLNDGDALKQAHLRNIKRENDRVGKLFGTPRGLFR